MRNFNFVFLIVLVIISLIFTITVNKIVPEHKFDPYILHLDSLWKKTSNQQQYRIDINNNQTIETIKHHNINISGHSIEFQQDTKISQIYIFLHKEKFIGKYLKFADIDGNSTQELLFVSVKKDTAYLNIFSYNTFTKEFLRTERIVVDSVRKHNVEIDVVNNFIITDGSDIYFDLQAGYSVQPRNIYRYDFKNKKLIKNRLNTMVSPKAKVFTYQNQTYLLATYVKATSNTISPEEAEMLRTSPDKDSVAIYERLKHLIYEYGDYSSYILLYDDSLRFSFEPIKFNAWTTFAKSTLVATNNEPRIVAFTNAQMNEPIHQKCKLVTVCNLQGEIIKQTPLPHNYTDIFSVNNNVVFYGDKTLFITDANLKPVNEIKNITFAHGFEDINYDNKPEFVAFINNTLTIYSSDFDTNASFKIEQEFAPYPEEYNFSTLQINNKNSFIFNSRLFYYQFSYTKNNIAFFKYPFLIAVFLVSFGILFLLFRLNSKRLEKENLKLEKTVAQRTQELKHQNIELATQKQEIEAQAEELKTANKKLVELDTFKQGLTSMIVHDLKNPLNGILNVSKSFSPENQVVQMKQTGKQMLHMVLNILDVQKYEENRMTVDKTNVSLFGISQSALKSILFLSEQKNISIIDKIQPSIRVYADSEIIERVFVNLLTNAIKYTPNNGSIALRATIDKMEDEVKISVTDTGSGIPQDKVHLVFVKFGQVAAKKSGSVRSTGLGLTFCKMAIEAHAGQIGVNSQLNKGTTFWFTLQAAHQAVVQDSETPVSEIVQEKLSLNAQEKERLAPYIKQLEKTEIYKMLELRKILRQITDENKNIKNWKNKLQQAIRSGNQKRYKELLKI